MKLLLKTLASLGLLVGVAACNTVEGAGQDVEYVGERVSDASDTVQEELDEKDD